MVTLFTTALGFSEVAVAATGKAKIFFFIFQALFPLSLFGHLALAFEQRGKWSRPAVQIV